MLYQSGSQRLYPSIHKSRFENATPSVTENIGVHQPIETEPAIVDVIEASWNGA